MNKNYLVTGGANGIGLELVRMALRGGGRVVITDVNVEAGTSREKEMQVSASVSCLSCQFHYNIYPGTIWKR